MTSAFAWHRIRPALVGAETHAAWLESIVADLAPVADGPRNAWSAVKEWQADRGVVVPEVLALVREVRAARMPVGLATNATNELDADLDKLGLTDEFDVVVNSSVIGVHKPSREFFAIACAAVRTPPTRCFSSMTTTATFEARGSLDSPHTGGTGQSTCRTCGLRLACDLAPVLTHCWTRPCWSPIGHDHRLKCPRRDQLG